MRISNSSDNCLPLSFHQKQGQQREDGCKKGHCHLNETLSIEYDATVYHLIDTHTAAFKLGGLFDTLALFTIRWVNL